MVTFKYWNKQLSPHTKLNMPDKFQYACSNTVGYLYDAAGSKLSVADTTVNTNLLVPMGKTVPLLAGNVLTTMKTDYCGNIIYEDGVLSKILTEEGYVTLSGSTAVFHYYLKDHEGNNRVVLYKNGTGTIVVEQVNNYYPFGGLYGDNTGGSTQPYMYNSKELDRMHGLDLFDYGARHYDAALGRWFTVDPLAEKIPCVSLYVYCSDNPVHKIDPDGRSEWPVNKTYNGNGRRHENNWHAPRPHGRLHQGVDINHTGGGNTDKGAPIVATHNGTVTSIGHTGDGNSGGNRIKITSADGTVSTSYMHLDATSSGVKVGSEINEGQQIGTMGRSGANSQNDYTAHLHYEISVDGTNINPANGANYLVDPQQIIDSRTTTQQPETIYSGGNLPEVTVVGPSSDATQSLLP